jgi:hypothetical protein
LSHFGSDVHARVVNALTGYGAFSDQENHEVVSGKSLSAGKPEDFPQALPIGGIVPEAVQYAENRREL